MPENELKYDPATPEGEAIARLFRGCKNIEDSDGNWSGGDISQHLSEWLCSLGIDPEGPAWQVDAIRPEKVSPDADPYTVLELLGNEPGFDIEGLPVRNEGFFYADHDLDAADETTLLTFPYASAARLRAALAALRSAGYTATEQTPAVVGARARTLRVTAGTVEALAADAPAADRAARLLCDAGIDRAELDGKSDVVACTVPTPVQWRRAWVQIDVTGPRTSGRDEREDVARAAAHALTTAGWRVDMRGTETLHTAPPIAEEPGETSQPPTTTEASTSGEVWQHGDVVLDASHRVWTRAVQHHVDIGWPWAHGADLTYSQGRPDSGTGSVSEDTPTRPLTLIIRNGVARYMRAGRNS